MQALLVPGTYAIPGVGQIVISAALVVLLGKTTLEVGTEIYNKVQDGLKIHFAKEADEAKKDIPERLKDGDGNVDIGKFKKKVKGKTAQEEDGGWQIEKDNAGHGGSAWKLKNKKGQRVASLDKNGKVLRK